MNQGSKGTRSRKASEQIACAGGCGPRGICPGHAVLLSLVAGYGISELTGWEWVLPVALVAGTTLLVTGLYRYLNPFRYTRNRSIEKVR